MPGTVSRYYRHVQLTTLDWVIVIISIVLSFVPAIYLMRRAGSSTTEFFTSGRAAPWWLIGGSMVATTFSTDTPNLVTNLVRENGVANNWVWWAFLLTGMSTVFFYARMWRRSGVLTDLEFYEIRYSGKAAALVRAFRAVYLGLFFNVVIMSTVNLAAAKIANVLRMERPEIKLDRHTWDDVAGAFTSHDVDCYRHAARGWNRIAACS